MGKTSKSEKTNRPPMARNRVRRCPECKMDYPEEEFCLTGTCFDCDESNQVTKDYPSIHDINEKE